MNLIGLIILITLVFDFLVHLVADFLNLKQLSPNLPEEFKGYYDQEKYQQSQKYLKTNTKFNWLISFFGMGAILFLWFGKIFSSLDVIVRSWNFSPIITGLIYMGILVLGRSLISLPFDLYSTFVIEERYGFNKTTWKTYLLDLIKGTILTIIIGGLVASGILYFFGYAGERAWLYCWIAMTLFMLIMHYLVPVWIMPLFNKFTPLEEGELREAILSYARSIKFPLDNIFIMDGSKRSKKSNAFFTGFGNHKRIVLFDTLVEQHSTSELVAILAHEMGHYQKKHILQGMIVGILQVGLMLFLLSFFINYQGLFEAFYLEQKSVYAGLIFFAMLYAPIDFILNIFLNILSRHNEYQADKFSMETTQDSQSLAEALKKLSTNNLSNLTPHPFYSFLNYSHPPILERLKYLKVK